MKITLIGAGNVGYHLGKRLYKKKFVIQQVYSRTFENAQHLAGKLKAEAIADLRKVDSTADLYILAVKDDVLATIAAQLAQYKALSKKTVVHTSGAIPSTVLAPYFKNYGVFYPLQTFSKSKRISFKNIPICIDAKKKVTRKKLLLVGQQISESVHLIKDKERAILHVAAVFVNNFTNYLFYIGQQICEEEQLDFTILKPLIQETINKIKLQAPLEMQTGPARRGDQQTIQKHLTYLERYPDYHRIYALLSAQIGAVYW